MEAARGGDSLVTEETADGARYYIRNSVEDNVFELGISIPEDYAIEITDFELWIDDVRIGERTEASKQVRHLAFDKDGANKVIIRLYYGDTFVDDCRIDPLTYEGPLEVTGGCAPVAKEDLTVAEYQIREEANGILHIAITPTGSGDFPAYYTVENRAGKRLYGKEMIPIEEAFTYLSLLNGALKELRVKFYNGAKEELYAAGFDTENRKLKKEGL